MSTSSNCCRRTVLHHWTLLLCRLGEKRTASCANVSPVDILDDQGMKYSVAETEEYVAWRCSIEKQEAEGADMGRLVPTGTALCTNGNRSKSPNICCISTYIFLGARTTHCQAAYSVPLCHRGIRALLTPCQLNASLRLPTVQSIPVTTCWVSTSQSSQATAPNFRGCHARLPAEKSYLQHLRTLCLLYISHCVHVFATVARRAGWIAIER